MFLHADRENSDQTGQMPGLIWVLAGRQSHFVGIVMRWLNDKLPTGDEKIVGLHCASA